MSAASARGVVISVHELGATVRLDDGTLASVPFAELQAHRTQYLESRCERSPLEFAVVERRGRRAVVALSRAAEPDVDAQLETERAFELQMTAYLKSTQTWAPLELPEPAERHFIRKKRRAAFFEARKAST